jgi:hypothetical protein
MSGEVLTTMALKNKFARRKEAGDMKYEDREDDDMAKKKKKKDKKGKKPKKDMKPKGKEK